MAVGMNPGSMAEILLGYVLLQAKEGDLVIFLMSGVSEVIYFGDKSFIMSHSTILMFE